MQDEYAVWLDEHVGVQVRDHLRLEPSVAEDYQRAFLGDPVGKQWMVASGPGVSIAPPGAPPELAAELDELAVLLDESTKAMLAGFSVDVLQATVDEARSEVDDQPDVDVPDDAIEKLMTGVSPTLVAATDDDETVRLLESVIDELPTSRVERASLTEMIDEDVIQLALDVDRELEAMLAELAHRSDHGSHHDRVDPLEQREDPLRQDAP